MSKWYPGKYLNKTWEGTKYVGTAVVENPGAAVGGALGGLIVGGPVGMVAGGAALASAAKHSKDNEKEAKENAGDGGKSDKASPEKGDKEKEAS